MKEILISIALIVFCAYLLIGLFLYLFQRQFIYFPTPEKAIDGVEFFNFASAGETLKILHLNNHHDHAVIYFGGNNEDVSHNLATFPGVFQNHAVYLVNYRGYSGSTGAPSEAGFYRDALNIYDHLKSKHLNISAIGRSLGSGVASYLATQRELEKLVLVTPYDSVKAVSEEKYPYYPISYMLKDHYDSYSRAHEIETNTLVIVAENDEIIPWRHTERLLSQLNPEITTVKIIPNVFHGPLDTEGHYSQYMNEYFMSKD